MSAPTTTIDVGHLIAGDGWGNMGLAQVAERSGDLAAAVAHTTRATGTGGNAAWAALVRLYWALGDHASALGAATRGPDAGHPEGRSLLARMRDAAGNRSGAAEAHREAAALGVGAAWRELALHAESAGDSVAANARPHAGHRGLPPRRRSLVPSCPPPGTDPLVRAVRAGGPGSASLQGQGWPLAFGDGSGAGLEGARSRLTHDISGQRLIQLPEPRGCPPRHSTRWTSAASS